MKSLIDYNGLKVVSPNPSNLGGAAINYNFKKLVEINPMPAPTTTFYVDNTSTQPPNGSFTQPFLLIQDAINAALAFANSPGGKYPSVLIQISPGKYAGENLTVTVPSTQFRLSIRGAGSGGCNNTIVSPINFILPDDASSNSMIAIEDISFVASSSGSTALTVTDAANAGYTLFYLLNVQCWAGQSASYAMHVTNAGGSGQLLFQCDGHCLIKSAETTASASSAVTGLNLERGIFSGIATSFYGLRAPAIVLSNTASLELKDAVINVNLGTAGAKNVDCVAASDTANVRLQQSLLTPGGNGQVISHTGTFTSPNGYVVATDMGAVLSGGTGGVSLPNGAMLFSGQMVDETGTPLAVNISNPALRVFVRRDANIGYTPADTSNWATAPPTNIKDAINRIAAAVVAGTSGPIA